VGLGDGALFAASDDAGQAGASVSANAPILATTSAGADDDPNLLRVGAPAAAPTIAATTPTPGQRLATDTVTFTGASSGAQSVSALVYDADGASALYGAVLDQGTGDWTAPVGPLGDGDYVAVVYATDALGVEAAEVIAFTVNADPPSLTLFTPGDGEAVNEASPTIAGSADPGQVVSLTLDSNPLPSPTANAQGFWSQAVQAVLAEGPHTLSVEVTDADGLSTRRDVTFSVDLSTTVSITQPGSPGGATNQARPTVSGAAEPGALVTVTFLDSGGAVADSIQVPSVPASGAWSVTPSADLPQDLYAIEVSSVDRAGNAANASTDLLVDLQAPSVTVTSPADGAQLSQAQPQLSGNTEAGARVFVSIDGAAELDAAVDATGRWTFTPGAPLADGPHTADVRAEDAAGNASVTRSISFTVDLNGPGVAFTLPADGDSIDRASFDIAGTSEPFALVTVSVDGAALPDVFVDGGGVWVVSPGPTLSEGPHVLSAQARDGVGNPGPTSQITVQVDLTNPTVSIDSPAAGDVLSDATPTLTGAAEPNATVEVRVDNIKVADTPVDAQGAWSYTLPDTLTLGDGPHGVSARATDASGRRSLFAAVSFTVDTQPPASTITSPADGDDVLSTLIVRGAASEPGSTVTLTVDPGTPSQRDLPQLPTDPQGAWLVTVDNLSPGPHTFVASATDAAGNTGDSAPVAVTVADDPLSIDSPAEGAVLSDATPILSGSARPGADLSLSLGGATAQLEADAQGRWTYVSPPLPQGVQDASLTSGAFTLTRSFSIDTSAPGLLFELPADGARLPTATPSLSGVTTPGQRVAVSVDGAPAGAATADALGNWSVTAAALGEAPHTATSTACDLAGNCARDQTSFFVDLTAPALSFSRPRDGATLTDTTPLVLGTSEPRATLELQLDGVVVSTFDVGDDGSWSYQILSPQTAGAHELTATATDAAGNAATAQRAFTVDTSRPILSLDAPRDGAAVPVSRPTLSGSANPNATVAVSIDGAPAGSATADAGGDWSLLAPSDLAAGTHTATATFDNGAVSVSDSVTFDVDLAAPGVQWLDPADGASVADATPSLTASTEPGAWALVTLPDGDTLALLPDPSGQVSFDTPALLPDGPAVFSIVATDPAGNRSPATPITVVVDTTADVSILSPDPDAVLPTGDLDVRGVAEPGADVSATLDGAPVGDTTAAADGAYTLTIDDLTAGAHLLVVSSTDPLGNTGQASVDFVADSRAPSLSIDAPADGSTLDTDLPTFQVSSAPDQPVSLTLNDAPLADLTTDASGQASLETAIADALAEGDYALVARAEGADGVSTVVTSTFTVDLPDATLTVDSPAPNTTVTTSTPTLSGTADPGVDVSIDLDGERLVDLVADANGLWRHVVPEGDALDDGPHILLVTSSLGARVGPFSFTVDATTVSIAFSSPRSGQALPTPTPTFAGTSDPEAFIELFIDDVLTDDTFADANGDWSVTLTDPLDDGRYFAEAVARVGLKGASTGARPFTIDTTAPEVTITQPTEDGLTQNDPFLVGTTEPGASVSLSIDDVPYETTRANPEGDWRVKVPTSDPLTPGPRTLTAVATDPVGNASAPASVSFTVLAPEGSSGGGAATSDEGCCATAPHAPRRAPLLLIALALVALAGARRRSR
jgi:hypothetical protein